MKKRDSGLNQLFPIWEQLKLEASDGKKYLTDCAIEQGILRIIQSIPSRKAEPFKLWLARVGKERIDEIRNPEGCKKGKLINEEILKMEAVETVSYKGRGPLKYEERIMGWAIM